MRMFLLISISLPSRAIAGRPNVDPAFAEKKIDRRRPRADSFYGLELQRRRLIGGYYGTTIGARQSRRAMDLLAAGAIQTEAMTTHRFPFKEGPEAFDLLYNHPDEAFGVLFEWD